MGALFVQPHPDDIALSMGGMVALTEGSQIITVFAEAPGADAPLGALARFFHERWGTSADTWTVRQREDADAAAVLGATWKRLRYCDAIYRGERYPTIASLTGGIHPEDTLLGLEIVADLLALWRQSGAGTIYLPLGAGLHVDHQLCHSLGPPLVEAGATVRYYEDFPYVLVDGALDKRLATVGPMVPEVVDITTVVDTRVAAIEAYPSQVKVLFRLDGSYPGPSDDAVKRYAARVAPERARYCERTWAPVA